MDERVKKKRTEKDHGVWGQGVLSEAPTLHSKCRRTITSSAMRETAAPCCRTTAWWASRAAPEAVDVVASFALMLSTSASSWNERCIYVGGRERREGHSAANKER